MKEIQVPHGWKLYTFEDLADPNHEYPIGDGDHGQIKPSTYQNNGIPYIRVADIVDNQIVSNKMVYISESVHDKNKKSHLIPEDIIIAKTGATIGKVAIIPSWMKTANTTSSVGKVTVNKEKILPKMLYYYVQTPFFKSQMWNVSIKSAQPGFNIINLKKFIIPIPDNIETQKKIIKKLDYILEQIGKKKKEIIELHDVTKIANILKNAKAELLRRFFQETTIQKSQHITKLADYIRILNGYAFKSDWFEKEGIKLIRNINVSHGYVDHSALVYLNSALLDKFKKFSLNDGDILISLDRPLISTGLKLARITKFDLPALLLQRVGKIQFLNNKLDPDYFFFWLQSQFFINNINPGRSSGVPHISSKEIEQIPFNAPSIIKQRSVVDEIKIKIQTIDEEQNKIKQIKELKESSILRIEQITDSILTLTFSGKLVN